MGQVETKGTRTNPAQDTYLRARELLTHGDFNGGEILLKQALRCDPEHINAKLTLAHFWITTKQTDQAESLINTITTSTVNPVTLLNFQGEIHLQRGRAVEAREVFEKSMSYSPSSIASVGLGCALTLLGYQSEAETLLRYTIEATDNCAAAYDALATCLMPGPPYRDILSLIHCSQNPATYLEIGVATGDSISLAQSHTRVIGVDPKPKIPFELSTTTSVYAETSDVFFEQYEVRELFGNKTIDFCFIDGLHTFDQALRDFINAEKHASANAVFVFHDCYPVEQTCATRKRQTTFWAGDVWKVIPILEHYRPDLSLHTIQTAPTGLGLVTGLDPSSTVLEENFDSIIEQYMTLEYAYLATNPAAHLHLVANDRETITKLLPG